MKDTFHDIRMAGDTDIWNKAVITLHRRASLGALSRATGPLCFSHTTLSGRSMKWSTPLDTRSHSIPVASTKLQKPGYPPSARGPGRTKLLLDMGLVAPLSSCTVSRPHGEGLLTESQSTQSGETVAISVSTRCIVVRLSVMVHVRMNSMLR